MSPSSPPASRGPFSATDAAFAGFRLARRRPAVVLVWCALSAGVFLALGILMVAAGGPAMLELQALGPHPDPQRSLALMGRLAPLWLILLSVSYLFYAVMFAAVNRAVLRPEAPGVGSLRLGRDELRQLGLIALLSLVMFGVYLVLVIGLVVVGVIAVGARAGGGWMLLPAVLVVAGGLVFVLVRLSLSSPLTFDTGRIDLRAAWRLTRGRFWPLLGAYVLASLVMVVVSLALVVAFVAVVTVGGGGPAAAAAVMRPDLSSVAAYLQPVQTAYIVLTAALYGLGYAVLIGAPAQAYSQIVFGSAARASDTDRSTAFGARA